MINNKGFCWFLCHHRHLRHQRNKLQKHHRNSYQLQIKMKKTHFKMSISYTVKANSYQSNRFSSLFWFYFIWLLYNSYYLNKHSVEVINDYNYEFNILIRSEATYCMYYINFSVKYNLVNKSWISLNLLSNYIT